MYITTWVYLLIALLPYCCRICSGMDDVLRLSSNFIESLLTTSSRHWIDQVKRHNVDVFSYNALFVPYQSDVQKSLFVSKQYKRLHETRLRRDSALRPAHSPIRFIKQKSIACIQSGIFYDTYLAQCFMAKQTVQWCLHVHAIYTQIDAIVTAIW